ncbi:uncharacterized protein SPSK_10297 [Sporothrix schenckii 1099-18]|uniref:Ubiquitin-like domain-containing protein n=1 Tax=Sporothrix schenckii 1099-18 TaxID=1397361 RepID=A0A0F2M2X0_SPOSC|nr:uncharacterized protein SPSK_10297 [Sporothrix schenckii 1099-18]KJR84047.1 hypothetical protein SPSK_10297 [Sporothrix schenckii 1099-18]
MNDNDRAAAGRPGRSSPFPSVASSSSLSTPFLSAPLQPHPQRLGGTPPLHLTARFLSLPDVHIDIPDPGRVTVVGLKTLIRKQLEQAAADANNKVIADTKGNEKGKENEHPSSSPTLHDAHRRRLRIIYAGKILADDVILGHVLRPVPPPPRAGRSPSVSTSAASTPVGNQSTNTSTAAPWAGTDTPPSASPVEGVVGRVYVNCSIGDILPESDLAAEADAAAIATAASAAALHHNRGGSSAVSGISGASTPGPRGGAMRLEPSHRRGASGGGGGDAGNGSNHAGPSSETQHPPQAGHAGRSTTTMPAPRGFERLLQAGFTAAEVNQLRLQFNTIQSNRFTPDTMPSPDALRTMEDNWLDNDQNANGTAAAPAFGRGGGGAGGGDDGMPPVEDTGLPNMLDTMVRAMVIGFMFPLGSMSWLMREEGLWTPRWRMFVSMGIVVSLMIGSVKTLAREW